MRIVDHQERRRVIAAVAMDLISREGLGATTLHRIAREMGASIRIVTHYFADKHTLLLWVYRTLAASGTAPIEKILARNSADLAGVLIAMCGTNEEMLKRWRVFVAFWVLAARSQDFATEQHLASERTLVMLGGVIEARLGKVTNVRQLAMELMSLVYGMSVQRMLDPVSWTPEAIADVIRRKVNDLLPASQVV